MERRRKNERAPFSGWVEIASADHRRTARGRDLSATGLGVALDGAHPPAGAELEGEFTLPGFALAVAVRAQVAWSDPLAGALGLRFEQLDPAVAELIENFVAGRL